MSSLEKSLRKRIALICACGALVLIALAVAQAKGALSSQTFAVLAVVLWIAMFAFLFPMIRRFNLELAVQKRARAAQGLPAESQEELAQRIRNLRRYIALCAILFPILLWANSDQSHDSKIVGTIVWLLLIGLLVRSLLRRQKEFQAREDSARTDKPKS